MGLSAPSNAPPIKNLTLRGAPTQTVFRCYDRPVMRSWTTSILIFAAACGGGSGQPKCVSGDSKSCTGPAACAGYQVCRSDGTYDPCICSGGGGAGGAGGAGGSGGGGSGGAGGGGGRGGTGGSTSCRDNPDASAQRFASEINQVATAICDWYQRCGQVPDGGTYSSCLASARIGYEAKWSEECNECPDGIVEERLTGICLDLIEFIPCNAMHGLGTYLGIDCGLSTLCYREPDASAGQ